MHAGSVSFFESFPPPPPATPPSRVEPKPWMGPSRGWVPGVLGWQLVLLRSESIYCAASGFEVFPTGVHFVLSVRVRPDHVDPSRHAGVPLGFRSVEGPRFGVGFNDGRKAMLGLPLPGHHEDPDGPVLWPRGGGGSPEEWRTQVWMWPLPPPEPLDFVAAWPAEEIPETVVTVDGAEIAEAASRAELLWEIPPDAPHGTQWSAAASTYAEGRVFRRSP